MLTKAKVQRNNEGCPTIHPYSSFSNNNNSCSNNNNRRDCGTLLPRDRSIPVTTCRAPRRATSGRRSTRSPWRTTYSLPHHFRFTIKRPWWWRRPIGQRTWVAPPRTRTRSGFRQRKLLQPVGQIRRQSRSFLSRCWRPQYARVSLADIRDPSLKDFFAITDYCYNFHDGIF